MIEIRASIRTAEVRRMLESMRAPRVNQALSKAVNDTARQVSTLAERTVAKEMGAKRKDLKGQFRIYPYSKPATLTAIVRGSGRPIPLMKFGARQTGKGVTASAWGVRKLYPGTFIAKMKSGHVGVFTRTTKKRFPIKELWGPGVAKTMADEAVSAALVTHGEERLVANVLRQLDRYSRSRS